MDHEITMPCGQVRGRGGQMSGALALALYREPFQFTTLLPPLCRDSCTSCDLIPLDAQTGRARSYTEFLTSPLISSFSVLNKKLSKATAVTST